MAIQVSIDVQIGNALRAIKEFEKKIKDLSNVASKPKDISALRGALSETKALKKDLALLAKQTKDTFGVFDAKEPLKALSAIEKKIEKIVTVGTSKVSVGMAKKLKEPFEETTLAVNKTKKSIENVITTQKNLAKSTAYLADPLTKKFSTLKTPFQGVDAQIKTISTSMSGLTRRLNTLQTGMTSVFQAGKETKVVASLANIKREISDLSKTVTTNDLLGTKRIVGRLGVLQEKFKDVAKEYNKLLNPPKPKVPMSTFIAADVGKIQTLLSEFQRKTISMSQTIKQLGPGMPKETFAQASGQIKVLENELKNLHKVAKQSGVASTAVLIEGFEAGSLALQNLRGHLKKSADFITHFSSTLSRFGTQMSMVVSVPLVLIGRSAFQAFGQLQQLEVAFKRLVPAAEYAGDFLKDLASFAEKTPFTFPELADSARRMLALGFSAKNTIPFMEIIGDAAAGLGTGSLGIERMSLALSQIMGKGKIMAQELNQLGEAGINAREALAKHFGIEIPELMKKVEKDGISAADGLIAILKYMNIRFSGMMKEQAKTLPGAFNILKNAVFFATAGIGKALSDAFNLPATLVRLSIFIKNLTKWFNDLSTPVKNTIVIFLTLAAITGPTAWGISKLIVVIEGLIKILKVLYITMLKNPWIALATLAIAAFLLIITHWDRVSRFFQQEILDMQFAWDKFMEKIIEGFLWLSKTGVGKATIGIIAPDVIRGAETKLIELKGRIQEIIGQTIYLNIQAKTVPEGDRAFMEIFKQDATDMVKFLEDLQKEMLSEQKSDTKTAISEISQTLSKTLVANKLLAEAAKITGKEYNRAAEDIQAMETAMSSYANLGIEATEQITKLANESKNLSAESEATALFLDRIKSIKDIFKTLEENVSDAATRFDLFKDKAKYADDLIKAYGKAIEDITALKISPEALDAIIAKLIELKVSPEVLTSFDGLKEKLEGIRSTRMIELTNIASGLEQKINELGGSTILLKEDFAENNEELVASGNKYQELIEWVKALSKEYKRLSKEARDSVKFIDVLKILDKTISTFGVSTNWMTAKLEAFKKALKDIQNSKEKPSKERENAIKWLEIEIKRLEGLEDKYKAVTTIIKSLWEGTTETFESAWKSAASSFVDKMLEVKMSGESTAKAIQVAFSSSIYGIIAMLASIAIQKVFTKPVKVELLATKLDKVFDEFIVNFKSALGEFRDILFSPKDEAAALFKTIETSFKGLGQAGFLIAALKGKAFKGYGEANGGSGGWWDRLNPQKTEQTSSGMGIYSSLIFGPALSANLYNAEKSKGYVIATTESRRAIDALNATLKSLDIKEIGSKKLWAGAGDPFNFKKAFKIEDIENAFVNITKKLGESATEIAGLMNDSFSKIKSLAEDTVAIYKEKLDFTKDMESAVSDIKKEMLATPELFKEQQKDVATLSTGLADFLDPQTQLAKINKIKEAGYVLEVQEKRIRDLKINDAKLTLDKIQEIKNANLDLWETVKTLISETFDLINQKAGFTQSIEDAIKDIKRSVLSPAELYNEQLKDVNVILNKIASTADEQAKLPLYDKLREAYQTAYATAQQIYNPASIRSELEGLYKRSTTETNLESLRDIGNQIRGLERDLVTAESGSKKAMDFAIKGLTALREQGGTSYDKLVAVNLDALGIQGDSSTWLEQLNKATGDWQTVIEANLKDLTKSGASAYDVMIAENLKLLEIDTMQLDIQTQMADYLSVIETNMIIALKSLNLMALNSSKAITSADIAEMMGKTVEDMDKILGDTSPLMYLLGNLSTSMSDLFKTPATTETVPKLAQGGIVTSPTLAVIGEKGPEAVIPLSGKMLPRIETEYNSMDKELESLAKMALGENIPQAKKDKKRGLLSNAYENLGFSKVAKEMSIMFKTFRDIPKLAMGGVVTKPTLAMIGESGAEAIVPLNQMKQSNVNINIEGAMVMDEITMSRWTRTLTKQIEKHQMRYA